MPSPHVVIDRVDEVMKSIRSLSDVQVMVGIPSTRNSRQGEPITNAALGYIHENGSPVRNIPARPFLRPGVQNAQPETVKYFRAAAEAAIEGKRQIMMNNLEAAGMNAATKVQLKITEGPFTPLAPSTIARRRAKLAGTTALTQHQLSQGFAEIRPLLDTGQLRAAITYVVRNRNNVNIGGRP